mmetsp:Transcript_10995/g.21250  ORF Transcript_10995/g.21250 Transcript_10995/m.21250 type:complete len:278 (-) Transcript_10995:32-865(-)
MFEVSHVGHVKSGGSELHSFGDLDSHVCDIPAVRFELARGCDVGSHPVDGALLGRELDTDVGVREEVSGLVICTDRKAVVRWVRAVASLCSVIQQTLKCVGVVLEGANDVVTALTETTGKNWIVRGVDGLEDGKLLDKLLLQHQLALSACSVHIRALDTFAKDTAVFDIEEVRGHNRLCLSEACQRDDWNGVSKRTLLRNARRSLTRHFVLLLCKDVIKFKPVSKPISLNGSSATAMTARPAVAATLNNTLMVCNEERLRTTCSTQKRIDSLLSRVF